MDAPQGPHQHEHEHEHDEEEGAGVSRWAFARLLDDLRARKDRQVRRLVRAGQPFVSEVRALDDDRVIGLLRKLGLGIDRAGFPGLVGDAVSAEDVADRLATQDAIITDGYDDDRLLFALGVLWERWLPERPSNEMIDDWMVAGYAPMRAGRPLEACAPWLAAWEVLLQRAGALGLRTLEGLEQATRLTLPIVEWVQDLPEQLLAAGKHDDVYHRRCIELIGECFARFETPHRPQAFEHLRVLLAEAHAELGEGQRTDALYRGWLATDPQWGWGYVCWSDCYRHVAAVKDLARAESVLREALKVEGLREEIEVLDRLVGVLDALERFDEADEMARQVEALKQAGAGASRERTGERGRVQPPEEQPEDEGTVVREGPKVGRNDPCPCGSGKKYKKCCGK